ncbi:MAG: hypothetical protein CVU00_13460 [Bacteroidetes bacterium HGW-Bacteroidetes-17]|jgi:PAS domain S-box-containing protein|nr:MAG: hypothetical protein CVU00_13460 [Bacteroidetes bacterium HGW-Bacteroidetes-17]
MSNLKDKFDKKPISVKNNYSDLQQQNEAILGLNMELQNNEKRIRRLIENLGSEYFFYSQDLNGKYVYVSPSVTTLLGYDESEVEYGILQFLTDHPKNEISKSISLESKTGKKQLPFEIEIRDKGGNIKQFELLEVPVLDENNNVVLVEGLAHEITERKRNDQVQEILGNISNAVLMSESLENLVVLIRDQLSMVIDTKNFYIALYDEITDSLSLPFMADEKDDVESFPAGKTMTGYVVKTRQSLLATYDEQEELVKKGKIDFVGSRSQIWLGVPLNVDDKVIGVLAVQSYSNAKAYNDKDRKILEIISNQISLAISRKRAEEKEKDQQELFDKITSSSNDAIIVINNKGQVIFWNQSAELIFGYTFAEIHNKDLHTLIRPEVYKQVQEAAFNHFKHTGEGNAIGTTVELNAIRKNGEEFPVAISLSAAKIKNEWNAIGTVRDITNRKIAENKLKEEKEFAERILKVVPSAVFTVDRDKRITSWNKKAEVITGWTRKEALGEPCEKFSLTSCAEKCQLFDGNIGETVSNHECLLKTKDGSEITILKSTEYLFDSNKNIIGGIESFEDISARKRTELIQKILFNISMAVNTTTDVADFIRYIQTQLGLLMDTSNFFVAFYDEESDTLSVGYIEDEKDEIEIWPAAKSLTGYAVKNKKTLFITKADIIEMNKKGVIDLIGTLAEVWVGVPLMINETVLGALVIQNYDDVNTYSKSDVELLEFISSQVSTAIERKKAAEILEAANHDLNLQKEELQQQNEEIEQQNEEIRAINDEMQVMNQDLLVSEAKVRRLIENLENEYIFYSQNNEGVYEYMSPSAQKLLGYSSEEQKLGLESFLTDNPVNKDFLKNLKPSKVDNIKTSFNIEIKDKHDQPRFFEVLRVPIYNKDHEITHFEGIAHEITARKKSELIQSIISNISNAVLISDDLGSLIQMIKDELQRLLDTRNFYIALYDEKTNFLNFPFFINEKDKIESQPLGKNMTSYVINSGKSLLADIPMKKKMAEEGKIVFQGSMSKVWLGVPLFMKDKVIGVIALQSYEDENAYNESDVQILEVISTQISLSIERKRTADQLKESNFELSTQKEELESTLEFLQNTQSQLIQTEKLAALGQLIAGIAHEINTPLGAINASVGNMSESLDTAINNLPRLLSIMNENDLKFYLKLMTLADNNSLEQSSKEKRQLKRALIKKLEDNGINESDKIAEMLMYIRVHEHIDEIIPMLRSENSLFVLTNVRHIISIRKNTQNVNLAVTKASKVVFALKKFAHRDHIGEKIEADIVDGIETVLILYHNQIKQGVEVIKDFKTIPVIRCYPDEMNQVWTNLFHNSLQAMDNHGTLKLSVEPENGGVSIKVSDTGGGIPEELREKIFQPFFTTKKAGEGSGLGLDIVKQIMKKHDGTIDFESEVGVGTTFKIWLPYISD